MNRRNFFKALGLEGLSLSVAGFKNSKKDYQEIDLAELYRNKEKHLGSKIFVIGFIPFEKDMDPDYHGTSTDSGSSSLCFSLVNRSHYNKWKKEILKKYERGKISYEDYLDAFEKEPLIHCYGKGHSCGEAYLALLKAEEKGPHIGIDVKGTMENSHLRVEELFVLVGKAKIPFFYK